MVIRWRPRENDSRTRRERAVDLYGSPNFRHTFSAIATSADEYLDIQVTFPGSRKYEPLMSLVLTNNSAADLDLAINGADFVLVPAGVITSVRSTPIWSIRLTNNDVVAAAVGTVRANLSTPPLGADELARRGG